MAVVTSTDSPVEPFTPNVQWPAYETKADLLRDLEHAAHGGAIVAEISQRLSRTDTSTWADKGSHVD